MPRPEACSLAIAFRRAVCCLLALAFAATIGPARADVVRFHTRASHSFSGFGVQYWAATDHRDRRDALLRSLRVRFVRVGITADIPDASLPDHATVAQLLAAIRANEDPVKVLVWHDLRDEMNRLGIGLDFIYWEAPPKWKEAFGVYQGKTLWRAAPAHLADYAHWIVAELVYAQGLGLRPRTIELANEPNGAWNTLYTPAQYDALVVLTRRAMDENGLAAIGIEGPGTVGAAAAAPYVASLAGHGELHLLARISVHDYDTLAALEPAGLSSLPAALRRFRVRLPVAATEFNSLRPEWRRPPYDGDPTERQGEHNAAQSDAYAVAAAGQALQLIADGAGAIFFWQLEDEPWGHDEFGLLDLAGQARPVATALGDIFSHVTPGARVFTAAAPVSGLAAVAFADGADATIALANVTPAARRLSLDFAPFPGATFALVSVFPRDAPGLGIGQRYRTLGRIVLPPRSLVVLRRMPGRG